MWALGFGSCLWNSSAAEHGAGHLTLIDAWCTNQVFKEYQRRSKTITQVCKRRFCPCPSHCVRCCISRYKWQCENKVATHEFILNVSIEDIWGLLFLLGNFFFLSYSVWLNAEKVDVKDAAQGGINTTCGHRKWLRCQKQNESGSWPTARSI